MATLTTIAALDKPLAERDNIHLNLDKQIGYDKDDNWVITTRGMGKSTLAWAMVYNQLAKYDRCSIVVKNQVVDITDAFIDDIEANLNLFRKPSQYGKLTHKGSPTKGIIDVYWQDPQWEEPRKLCRIIALSIKVSRYKSLVIPKPGIVMFDECLPNLRIGEKWLKQYTWRCNELYSTFSRYAWLTERRKLKQWHFGNPYSRYIPNLYDNYKVDTLKLMPGNFIVGDNYTINLATPSDELVKWLQEANPTLLNEINTEWSQFMKGEFINDKNYEIHKSQPDHYKLRWVFQFGGTYLGIFRRTIPDEEKIPLTRDEYYADWNQPYWISILPDYSSKYKTAMCFDLNDLCEGSIVALAADKKKLNLVKRMIASRMCTFQDVNAASITEQLFLNL